MGKLMSSLRSWFYGATDAARKRSAIENLYDELDAIAYARGELSDREAKIHKELRSLGEMPAMLPKTAQEARADFARHYPNMVEEMRIRDSYDLSLPVGCMEVRRRA